MERANKTLQDRLVKELRLLNISAVEEANGRICYDFMQEYGFGWMFRTSALR